MDVVWDQDVRTALSAIISREVPNEATGLYDVTDDSIRSHINLAVAYAEALGKARAILERKPPVQQNRPPRYR